MADTDFVTEGQINALVTEMYQAVNGIGGGGPSVFSYCQTRNTETSVWINSDVGAIIPITGIIDHTEADYTVGANGITVNFDGVVSVYATLGQYGTARARTAVSCHIEKNGVRTGPVGRSGYLREINNHNETSSNAFTVVDVVNGDEFLVIGQRHGNTGEVNQRQANASSLVIVRYA